MLGFKIRLDKMKRSVYWGIPGWRFACYLAAEFPQIWALILLDGATWIWKRSLPLEEELEGTSSFMQQQVFVTVEEVACQQSSVMK